MSDLLIAPRDENGSLAIPGVKFLENQLAISDDVNRTQIRDLIRFLVTVEGCSLFWCGDLLNWLRTSHNQEVAIEAANQFDNPDRLLEAMVVCEGLKSRKPISYAHHREAYAETGKNSKLALEWLAKAEEYQWSVAEMRRQIRWHSEESIGRNKSKGSATLTTVISAFKARISNLDRPIADWSIDETAAMVDELPEIEEFVRKVRDRFNHFNPEFAV